jgi:hypothetical protein
MDTAGRLRRLWPSSPYGCPPHRRALRAPPVRTQRTRERTDTRRSHRTLDAGHPDTGHPDTGHPDAQTPTPDTGHRSRGHRTRGRRTPAEDGRGQVDQGTAGIRISWGQHAGRLPRWDADPCSCGWRLRRSAAPCKLGGEATCQPETTYRATSCSAAPPAKARLGALLSCVGWYEGRAMGLRKGEGVRGRVGEAMLMAVLQ